MISIAFSIHPIWLVFTFSIEMRVQNWRFITYGMEFDAIDMHCFN